jgi:hypothetical protein
MTEQNDETTEPAEEVTEPEETETETEPEPEQFPAEYVRKLRDEAAKHRTRAQRADDLAARLHTALVAATGRLADPDDLPYKGAHLDDPDALAASVDELLARKPHLASRKPSGDVGQGASASADVVDLAELLRGRAK